MTPTDPIDAFVLLAAFAGMFGLPMLGVIALLEWLLVKDDKQPRAERLSDYERDLLGDDWRDSIAHLFPDTNERREIR